MEELESSIENQQVICAISAGEPSSVRSSPLSTEPDRAVDRLDVILKVAERCNLACTYCYFFADDQARNQLHPSRISLDTVEHVVAFLQNGATDLGVQRINVIFHGGEPTMMRLTEFDELCTLIRSSLDHLVVLALSIQTNASLLTSGWLRLFKKHRIGVGVSLDGPQHYNDIARIDHRGRSTYAATKRGISLLMTSADAGELARPGALFVINPTFDPVIIYEHLVKELHFDAIDALLPDHLDGGDAAPFGSFLTGLFDVWVRDANPAIYIRIFRALLDRFADRGSYLFPVDPIEDGFMAINVASDGALYPDDVIVDERWSDATVMTTTLREFSKHPLYHEWLSAGSRVPVECEDCCWVNVCRGGHPWHRYKSDGQGFDRKSVYCVALKELFSHVTAFMLESGYPLQSLLAQLRLQDESADGALLDG